MTTAIANFPRNESRKQELLSLIAKGATDKGTFEELRRLNEVEENARQERRSRIDEVVKLIAELGIRFSEVAEAFSDDQIREVAVSRAIRPVRRGGLVSRRTSTRISRKSGEVLIEAMNSKGKGNPATYTLGQALPKRVPRAFKALLEGGDAQLDSALAARFTEAGKAHFATEQGRNDLAAFARFVRTVKPR